MDIDFSQLEAQFAAKPMHAAAASVRTALSSARPQIQSILDADRSRNVAVFSRGLKLDARAVSASVDALILSCTGCLSQCLGGQETVAGECQGPGLIDDAVQGLLSIFPTEDEAGKLAALKCEHPLPVQG